MRLPGLLNARIVRPKTLGSTLVSVGKLDKKQFPNTQLVVKGNLVAVLSTQRVGRDSGCSALAGKTKWTRLGRAAGQREPDKALRVERDYSAATMTVGQNKGNAGTAPRGRREADLGHLLVAVPQARPDRPVDRGRGRAQDGTAYIWAHTQSPQPLRKMLASTLETSPDNVIVRVLDGSGHYGRSNPGPDGAEADAVILSQAVGKPVRVQWMRQEDMTWSISTFPQLADIQVGLDANGNMVAFQADYHQTGRFDGRGLGGLLAGLPPGALEDGTPKSRSPQGTSPGSRPSRPSGPTRRFRTSSRTGSTRRRSARSTRPTWSACGSTACARPSSASRTSRSRG